MIKPFRRWRAGAIVLPVVLLGSAAVAIGGGPTPTSGPTPGVPKKLVTVNETVATKSTALCPVGRWIDSGGDPALLNVGPPPRRVASEREPISKLWHEARARNDAVQAVRSAGPGADRAELRTRLERELAGRGLTESPLWYEQPLDQLGASRAEEAQRTAEGWKALGPPTACRATREIGGRQPNWIAAQAPGLIRFSTPCRSCSTARWTSTPGSTGLTLTDVPSGYILVSSGSGYWTGMPGPRYCPP